ncbi:hypothetical protein ALI22I_33360 [Saccharothrix sp. ALI-22-I]|uniref:TMF family protein n=1 Tax=Saccharothrix sp. ALI-22-I TaxID=1933778 RepID=UPI00097C2A3F|nr:TMF family protein [Saccharothrix sp. ALI-22-I]ONI83405.1 hypothetical protein ALI22I_33360 [Saccharothrix sp. ALI-22-I]
MSVSAATDKKIRAAMERLLNGEPTRCDGKLTYTNLAKEASVGYSTLWKADTSLLTEFKRRAAGSDAPAPPAVTVVGKLTQQRDKQAAKITRLRAEKAELEELVRVLKHEIAALVVDNEHQQAELERLRARIRRLEGGNVRTLPQPQTETDPMNGGPDVGAPA